jgi:hypothetical protein
MRILTKYYKEFLLRGLVAMGFGSIVLSVVYGILGEVGVIEQMSPSEVVLGYLTITLLAFICGAANVVFKIEELAISKAITIHGISLYIAYAVVYFANGWIGKGIIPFAIFSAIFATGYLIVWIVIYFVTKKKTEKLNNKLKNRAE